MTKTLMYCSANIYTFQTLRFIKLLRKIKLNI